MNGHKWWAQSQASASLVEVPFTFKIEVAYYTYALKKNSGLTLV